MSKGSKSKNSGRVASANANRLRRLLRDESGRLPQDDFDLSKVALPDWFYEPRAFQERVKLRKLQRLDEKRRKFNRLATLTALGFVALSEDGRHWHPGRSVDRAPKLIDGRPARILEKPFSRLNANTKRRSRSAARLLGAMSFQYPEVTAVCVRRKQRREVIHALGKAGRGRRRPPRRNQYSTVRC